MSTLNVAQVLQQHRIVLCGGSGGVGKTTTAAALGMLAAQSGRRTLVLTIDPARRLADAMGLAVIGNEPTPVPAVPNLSIMMLSAADSMDELVARHATNQADRDALLGNPYYQQISASVAGSREFLAMEKLHELAADRRFDLLVVDTPPSQHALDFIDAPQRLLDLLDGSGLGLILRTTSMANRLSFGMVGQSQKQFAKLFEKLTGHRLMLDLTAFFETFQELITGFKQRAATMQKRLRSADTAFLLVQLPQPESLQQAQGYVRRLQRESMQVAGVIFNQVHQIEALSDAAVAALNTQYPEGDLARRVLAGHAQWYALARAQRELIAQWQAQSSLPVIALPFLVGNVSSLATLGVFASSLDARAG
ncbi:MAG: ArsA family ATPase [Pseudomonadales bacterium]